MALKAFARESMGKNLFIQFVRAKLNFSCFLFASNILFLCFLTTTVNAVVPSCYMAIERNFFQAKFIMEALAMHDVSQSAWLPLTREIQSRARLVPDLVKEQAARVNPNPFNIPFQPEAAGRILQEVLTRILRDSLAIFNIYDQQVSREMFAYIRGQQALAWEDCFPDESKLKKQDQKPKR